MLVIQGGGVRLSVVDFGNLVQGFGPGVCQPAAPTGEVIFDHQFRTIRPGFTKTELAVPVRVNDDDPRIIYEIHGVPVVFIESLQGQRERLFGQKGVDAQRILVGPLRSHVGGGGEPDISRASGDAEAGLLDILEAAHPGRFERKILGNGYGQGHTGLQSVIGFDELSLLYIHYFRELVCLRIVIPLLVGPVGHERREAGAVPEGYGANLLLVLEIDGGLEGKVGRKDYVIDQGLVTRRFRIAACVEPCQLETGFQCVGTVQIPSPSGLDAGFTYLLPVFVGCAFQSCVDVIQVQGIVKDDVGGEFGGVDVVPPQRLGVVGILVNHL